MVLDYLLLDHAALPRHLASLNHFFLSKKVEGRSPATLEWLGCSLNDFYHFLKNSVNDKYRALSSYISWCLAEGAIKESPLKNIKPPTRGKPQLVGIGSTKSPNG